MKDLKRSANHLPSFFLYGTLLVSFTPLILNLFGVDPFLINSSSMGGEVGTSFLRGHFTLILLEWAAAMIAIGTCFLALMNYFIKQDSFVPIFGIALLSFGVVDAFYVLISMGIIKDSSLGQDLVSYTWSFSRLFNSSMSFFISSFVFLNYKKLKIENGKLIFSFFLLIAVTTYVSIHYYVFQDVLPQLHFADSLIVRPWDFYSLFIFLASGLMLSLYHKVSPSPFSHSLLLNIIPNIVIQLYTVFNPHELFESHFNIVHILKIFSYALPFFALCWSYLITNKEKELIFEEMNCIHEALDDTALVSESDIQGNIISCNSKQLDVSKYSLSEMIGKNYKMLNSGHHSDFFFKEMWEKVKSGETWRGQIKNKDKEGTFYWTNTTIYPVKNKSGKIVKFISIKVDITKQINDKIELKKAKKEAERLTKVKSEFLANMSHEIRTPMNGILGMVSLLEDTELSEKQMDMIENVKSCGEGLLTIINDILDLGKIESGKMVFENIVFDLRKCVKDSALLLSRLAQEKKIDIIVDINEGIPKYLIGDELRLRQILVNLISNGVKFTSIGSVTINVESVFKKDNLYDIIFKVRDTGIGIELDKQKNLFQSFSQADNSISRKFGGTGLGLVISSRLCQMMGGGIFLESKIGIGTSFQFNIPMEKSSIKKIDMNLKKIKDLGDLSKDFPHSILLVEDNDVNQKIASLMFKKLGYSCDVAENGEVALKYLEKTKYDIVFMDMQMPIMDGITATKEIIKIYGKDAPVIIAMTANVFVEDKEKCFEVGMSGFIGKPIDLDEIAKVLMKPSENKKSNIEKKNSRDLEVFSSSRIKKIALLDHDTACEVVTSFLQSMDLVIEEIRNNIEKKDFSQIHFLAHSLKNSSGEVGAIEVRLLAESLEQSAKSNDIIKCNNVLEDIVNNIEVVNPMIENCLEELKAS